MNIGDVLIFFSCDLSLLFLTGANLLFFICWFVCSLTVWHQRQWCRLYSTKVNKINSICYCFSNVILCTHLLLAPETNRIIRQLHRCRLICIIFDVDRLYGIWARYDISIFLNYCKCSGISNRKLKMELYILHTAIDLFSVDWSG